MPVYRSTFLASVSSGLVMSLALVRGGGAHSGPASFGSVRFGSSRFGFVCRRSTVFQSRSRRCRSGTMSRGGWVRAACRTSGRGRRRRAEPTSQRFVCVRVFACCLVCYEKYTQKRQAISGMRRTAKREREIQRERERTSATQVCGGRFPSTVGTQNRGGIAHRWILNESPAEAHAFLAVFWVDAVGAFAVASCVACARVVRCP